MLKMVLKDYKSQLKLDCLLDINFLIAFFIIIYFNSELLFLGIPYLVGEILQKNCNIKDTKTFYMCPLSLDDRKKYVKASIFINLLIPIILFFIVGIILLIMDYIDTYILLYEALKS